jgi:hypothetical protein
MIFMHTRSLFRVCVAGLLCLAAGCGSDDVYEIDLTPKGDQLERKLVMWIADGGTNAPSPRETARIALLYPSTFQPDHGKQRGFIGTFGGRMPEDIGARGTYVRYTNRMGSTSLYVERFRGDADAAAQIERRQQAAATTTRFIRGWCKQEFGREPGWRKLREFIDRNLAHDLLTVSLYLSPVGAEEGDPELGWDSLQELLVRVGEYFFERDYFTIEDLPGIMHGLDQDNPTCLAAIVRRKLGRPAEGASLAVFSDRKRLEASWDKYLASTPDYRKLLAEFKQSKDPKAEPPKPSAVFDQAGSKLLDESSLPRAQLSLRLHVQCEPYATNGEWDETTQTVQWNRKRLDAKLPALRFASWSEPEADYQKEHFGCVFLDGDALAMYSFWYRQLASSEAAEWERFLNGLDPTQALVERLEAFRFRGGAAADGAELLRKAILKKREESKAKPQP